MTNFEKQIDCAKELLACLCGVRLETKELCACSELNCSECLFYGNLNCADYVKQWLDRSCTNIWDEMQVGDIVNIKGSMSVHASYSSTYAPLDKVDKTGKVATKWQIDDMCVLRLELSEKNFWHFIFSILDLDSKVMLAYANQTAETIKEKE